jgi:hypothetical protein
MSMSGALSRAARSPLCVAVWSCFFTFAYQNLTTRSIGNFTMFPSTTSTTQTTKPFDMEEFCKQNEREFKRLGIPVYDINVGIAL